MNPTGLVFFNFRGSQIDSPDFAQRCFRFIVPKVRISIQIFIAQARIFASPIRFFCIANVVFATQSGERDTVGLSLMPGNKLPNSGHQLSRNLHHCLGIIFKSCLVLCYGLFFRLFLIMRKHPANSLLIPARWEFALFHLYPPYRRRLR